jgi:hypothetical protein
VNDLIDEARGALRTERLADDVRAALEHLADLLVMP